MSGSDSRCLYNVDEMELATPTLSPGLLRPSATVGLAMVAVGLVMTYFDPNLLIGRVFVLAGAVDLLAAFVHDRLKRRATETKATVHRNAGM